MYGDAKRRAHRWLTHIFSSDQSLRPTSCRRLRNTPTCCPPSPWPQCPADVALQSVFGPPKMYSSHDTLFWDTDLENGHWYRFGKHMLGHGVLIYAFVVFPCCLFICCLYYVFICFVLIRSVFIGCVLILCDHSYDGRVYIYIIYSTCETLKWCWAFPAFYLWWSFLWTPQHDRAALHVERRCEHELAVIKMLSRWEFFPGSWWLPHEHPPVFLNPSALHPSF